MGIHIAIIDDGINEGFYKVGQLQYNIEITPALDIQQRVGYDPLLPSHGTTCAAIIKKYAPSAVLSSVKVLNDDSKKGMKAQLVKALEWCAENNIRLINLSLGTVDYRDFREIEAVVKKAVDCGSIVVAACNNRNVFTCPASLKEAIGVKCDLSGTLKNQEYIYNLFMPDGIEITAGGMHQLVQYTGGSKTTSPCNSFAAPLITAVVHGIMEKDPGISLGGIREGLARNQLALHGKKIEDVYRGYKYIQNDIDMDIPIMTLYDGIGMHDHGIKGQLHELFRRDGYNAISIYRNNFEEDVCKGIISIESFIKSGEHSYHQALKEVCRVYNPDIIMVNMDIQDIEGDYIKELESAVEIDMKVFVLNKMDDQVKAHIHNNDGSEIILLANQNTEAMVYDKATVFTYSNKSTIDKAYKHILSLFEVDEGEEETIL